MTTPGSVNRAAMENKNQVFIYCQCHDLSEEQLLRIEIKCLYSDNARVCQERSSAYIVTTPGSVRREAMENRYQVFIWLQRMSSVNEVPIENIYRFAYIVTTLRYVMRAAMEYKIRCLYSDNAMVCHERSYGGYNILSTISLAPPKHVV